MAASGRSSGADLVGKRRARAKRRLALGMPELLEDRRVPAVGLDTAFGLGGVAPVSIDVARSSSFTNVRAQADGRIVALALTTGAGDEVVTAVVRMLPDGSLDTSFSGDGMAAIPLGASTTLVRQANALRIQPDGKIVVGGSVGGATDDDFFVARLNADGTPDTTFGTGGAVISRFEAAAGRVDTVQDLAVQADGAIVAVGQVREPGQSVARFGAARFGATGVADGGFGTGGVLSFSFPGTNGPETAATAVGVQADGKIVVGGNFQPGSSTNLDMAVARLNPNGALDPTFDGDGMRTVPFDQGGVFRDTVSALAIRPGGQIVLVGSAQRAANNSDFAVAQLTAAGGLDATFGNAAGLPGRSLVDFGLAGANSDEFATGASLLADGRLLIGGPVQTTEAGFEMGVARLTAAGAIDAAFSGDGRATIGFEQGGAATNDQLRGLAVQPDGRVVLAGSSIVEPDSLARPALARLDANGAADTTFDGDGKRLRLLSGSSAVVGATATQADGKALLASAVSALTDSYVSISRTNADGTPDTTFGTDGSGVVLIRVHPGVAEVSMPRALAVRGDGKILVAGSSSGSGGANDFFVARLNSNGALDPTFSGDGVATVGFDLGGTNSDDAYALLPLPDNSVVVGGSAATASGPLFALAKLGDNGALVGGFDTDGKLTIPSAGFGFGAVRSLARQSTGQVIAAGSVSATATPPADLGVARLDATSGLLDNTFDGDGRATITFDLGGAGQDEQVAAVAVDSADRVVVLGDSTVGGGPNRDLVVARLTTAGTLDNTFDGDGRAVIAINAGGTNVDRAGGLVILAGDAVALSATAERGGAAGTDLAFARLNANGSADTTVAPGGGSFVLVGMNFGAPNNDRALGLARTADGAFLIGAAASSDVPPAGMLGGMARLVDDTTAPALVGFTPVSPNPRNTPVLAIDVTFTEDIDLATFAVSDLALSRGGVAVALGAPASITRVGVGVYRIAGLQDFTAAEGSYTLALDGAKVADTAGNMATGTAQTSFGVLLTGPVAQSIATIAPDPRNTPVATIDVFFSGLIDPATFTLADVALSRDGAAVPTSGGQATLIDAATGRYRLSGLGDFTAATGNYTLTVQAAGIADTLGNPASGTPTAGFRVDATAPTITLVGAVTPNPSKYPANTALPVVFSEEVVGGLSRAALTLTRDGVAVPLTDAVTVTRTGAASFQIAGLTAATRISGTYRLTVNPAGLTDALGNPAAGTGATEFVIRRGVILGDYDGDGIVDLATYVFDEAANAGRFDIQRSSDGQAMTISLGTRGEIPVAGDFDGDGKNDVAVYNPEGRVGGSAVPNAAVWTYIRSSDGNQVQVPFGGAGILDRPAPGDFDGDGITDIATFRANSDLTPDSAEWFVRPSSNINAGYRVIFGAANGVDLPAVADYDNDFKDDVATYRPQPHPNDLNFFDPEQDGIGAQWFLLQSAAGAVRVEFGAAAGAIAGRPADQPALADYDGDGRVDITAFRVASDLPGTTDKTAWFIVQSSANGATYPPPVSGGVAVFFAAAGDLAAQGDYDGDGVPDLAAFNAAARRWTIRDGLSTPERLVTFGPPVTSTNAVPVLAPLYFRLVATGNPVDGVGATGGGGDGLTRFAGAPDRPRVAGGSAPAYASLGGLAGFGLASAGPGGAAASAGASDSDREEAIDLALEDWA